MQAKATVRYVPISPYKLRLLVDVIRGKDVAYALGWLAALSMKRVRPIKKMLESAVANAKSAHGDAVQDWKIRSICVDQGPTRRYMRPGAQGRGNLYRRRFSHMSVVLEDKTEEA